MILKAEIPDEIAKILQSCDHRLDYELSFDKEKLISIRINLRHTEYDVKMQQTILSALRKLPNAKSTISRDIGQADLWLPEDQIGIHFYGIAANLTLCTAEEMQKAHDAGLLK